MISIRLLEPGDAHFLNTLASDVFDDPIVVASAQAFLNDSRHRLVAALDQEVVVGFVSAVVYLHPDKPAPEMWINEIGVAPTHRRKGIGKALLQVMLKEARRSGCREAWVLTERENSAAMAMYRSASGEESQPDPTMFSFKL